MKNFGDVEWIFNKTDVINNITTLKTKVMGALNVKDLDAIPLDNVKKLLLDKNFGEIDRFNKSEKLLKALNDDSIFESIFKIAE